MTPQASAPAQSSAIASPVAAADVVLLQSARQFPSVSLLLSTTPASRLTLTDQTRLSDMVDQAVLRLRRVDGTDPDPVIRALAALAVGVTEEPASQALALYANADTAQGLRLGVGVTDRVVIDSTFATRDLVLALQRTPRHVVLVLGTREARLFESINGSLQPAGTSAFPVRSRARSYDFLRSVDLRLGTYRALHPSPLVLVGPPPAVEAFMAVARHTSRLAGTLSGDHLDASLAELAALTRPVLRRYLASREQDALELISARARQGRVASGMPAAWLAARTERPEMLAVEENLFYPAHLSPDGHTISLTSEVDQPDVVDDAVDELIEHVLIRGGWIAIVGDGALARHQGVALVRR